MFSPASALAEWVAETFISGAGKLVNPDHAHLLDASIAYLWASSSFEKRGRIVIGQCEEVVFRCSGWQRQRQEQQIMDWFGAIPNFIITISAEYAAEASDAEFCALIEHELYHIAHDVDVFGAPRFTQGGMPKLKLRGHDVEEFIGVVRRYGAAHDVAKLVEAANHAPQVAKVDVARACGTCQLKRA